MQFGEPTMIREFTLATLSDGHFTDLACVGGGEGFGTYVRRFEGAPAFIVNSGTMADFMDDDDTTHLVSVRIFVSEAARDEYAGRFPHLEDDPRD